MEGAALLFLIKRYCRMKIITSARRELPIFEKPVGPELSWPSTSEYGREKVRNAHRFTKVEKRWLVAAALAAGAG